MLDREALDRYIADFYGTQGEQPWAQYPSNRVYRHRANKKWFAVVMTIHKSKLGLTADEAIDVVNLKCDPVAIGSFLKDDGIFPGYHMNKSYWITVALDGSVDDEKIKMLLDISFELTQKR